MIHRIACLLTTFVMVAVVHAEAPFQDLSFEAALKKAAAEKKLVMVDFFTTWCGPCKQLDKTTWKDAKVQSWLDKHTIALKIDAEKQVALARKYKVRAFPTMTFINPDGSTVGSMVGYHSAENFISVASDRIAGITELSVARDRYLAKPNDASARLSYADELTAAGKYQEAMEQYDWLWNKSLAVDKNFYGVRLSFMLADLEKLARKYKPAAETLAGWYQGSVKRLEGEAATKLDASEFISLARVGGVPSKSILEVCERYDKRKDALPEVKRILNERARDLYFDSGDYAAFLKAFSSSPLQYVQQMILSNQNMNKAGMKELDQQMREMVLRGQNRRLREIAARIYQAQLATGQEEKATVVGNLILKQVPGQETLAELTAAAKKAGKPDAVRTLDQD